MTTRTVSKFFTFIGIVFVFCFIILVPFAFAEETKYVYKYLVGIPGLTDGGQMSLPQYINKVYLLLIGLGSLFGVYKIAETAVKYSLSEIAPVKADLRKEIQNILLGLTILLLPYLVLNEVNPELTDLSMLQNVSKISLPNIPQKSESGQIGALDPTKATTAEKVEFGSNCSQIATYTENGTTKKCCAAANAGTEYQCPSLGVTKVSEIKELQTKCKNIKYIVSGGACCLDTDYSDTGGVYAPCKAGLSTGGSAF